MARNVDQRYFLTSAVTNMGDRIDQAKLSRVGKYILTVYSTVYIKIYLEVPRKRWSEEK